MNTNELKKNRFIQYPLILFNKDAYIAIFGKPPIDFKYYLTKSLSSTAEIFDI